jgi:hypothetical protein
VAQALRVEVDSPGEQMRAFSLPGAPGSRPAIGAPSASEGSRPASASGDGEPASGMVGQRDGGTEGPKDQGTTQPSEIRYQGAAPREGKLTFLDNSVQSGTGTVKLRATVPNPDRYFWPGQFVNVRLILAMQKDAVLIPAQAQQIGQQGPFVYVVGPGDVATIRPIVFGQRHGDLLVADQGLAAGERIIVTGHMMVTPEAKVMVVDPNAAHGPPGAPSAAAPAGKAGRQPEGGTEGQEDKGTR